MLKVYNTLSKKKEIFRPKKGKKVNFFVCGPTVYDFSHLGHARTYIAFDTIVKYLRSKGFAVFYLQNITDMDDKIISRARENRTTPIKLAKKFEKEYFKDIKILKIDSVSKYARATEHIPEIISQVKRLIQKGFAYEIEDGVYYDITRFKDYGKLSRRTVLQAEDSVSRIDESVEKKNKGDFCLWKKSKPGEPRWKSPWGWGRPGWHIEDTAITEKYFGPQYDIHGGARDLIFPHHEAEIAQMEAISGKKPLVKYWFHTGFLTIKGEKMSKSLGNFITIKDFLRKKELGNREKTARILRLFFLKSHYRSPIDYNEKTIDQTEKELEKIDDFLERIQDFKNSKTEKKSAVKKIIAKAEKEFKKAMENDFNTPVALAVIFKLINKVNALMVKEELNIKEVNDILSFFHKANESLTFISKRAKRKKITKNIKELVEQREKYRREKQWQKADEIRKEIEKRGYIIEDTKEGPKIKKI